MWFLFGFIVAIAVLAFYLHRRGSTGISGEDKSVERSLGQSHRGGPGGMGGPGGFSGGGGGGM